MTSQESIGNCSLDVDRSTSDRSDINVGSLSEKTLHSLNLSYNGEAQVSPKNAHQCISIVDTLQRPTEKSDVSNGYHGEAETDQLTTKKPSYLGLACSINGYSGITRYDSKLREGFRSRDSSPGARLITRDISPAGFRSNENLTVPVSHPPKSQSISPLAMDRHNGFSNGTKGNRKIDNYIETRSSTRDCQGYSEVDRGTSLLNAFPDLSPIRSSSPNKRTGFKVENYNHQNKTYTNISVSSPKKSAINVSNSSDTSLVNGSQVIDSQVFNSSSGSEKSFIQQRVERLYGPGALAQGFFFKRSSGKKLNLSDSFNKSSNNNNTSLDDSNTEESLKNLPVLRHLRPEFRAQLPVVSPRRPTDGSEQVIKPLQRLSVSAKKNDAKEIKVTHKKETSKEHESSNTSTNSISDQQPAAPKVVLPVLDNTTSKPGVGKEEYVEKNGHYFITLLKREISRLHSLAESAEAELEHTRPDELPEEAAGKLRSAAGKARLLASQKMQQFEGLCQKNINQIPGEDFPTTNEDLAGFWDMVMLQVDQVNELFEHIERLRKSNWVEVAGTEKIKTPQNGNASKRRTSGIPKAKPAATPSEASRKAREAREASRRQMLEERRRAMKANSKKSDSTVEIFVPET